MHAGFDPRPFRTHEVGNQPPPIGAVNLFSTDQPLVEAVCREGADWGVADLQTYGMALGQPDVRALGAVANREPPRLVTHDPQGRRCDWVEFHPAYHDLMRMQVAQGVHASPWSDPRRGAHVHRAAGLYMGAQVEAGTSCPISMTYAAAPVIAAAGDPIRAWLPKLHSRRYDPAHRPAQEKSGVMVGMGMTEKQGGSDVRTNATTAEPLDPASGLYRIVGHKWFFSAPMCDAFLILAQAPKGLTCFFLPRWTPDGQMNALRLQRLKDKLGNRSNASSEVEFEGALAWLVGEEGRGVATIIEMVGYTRLDNVVGSAAVQRQAMVQALRHARGRTVFQRRLVDQPLMTNVLADLALEVEAATAVAFRLAGAFDRADDPADALIRRLVTPAAKFWVCKRGPALAAEALEVLGGNGYVEESGLARLYRELPVYSIWEGSGNVMCLDLLRALRREPAAIDALAEELEASRGGDARLDRAIDDLLSRARGVLAEAALRRFARDLVVVFQAALLIRHAPSLVSDAFIASRIPHGSDAFGQLPDGMGVAAILERALPI
ncbi:MAG TPA: isovaleryl-CoA dehydrogenase [Phenylobacterium sp.]|nr:isovaleryl-CoA dehydrogenase [Phenylobacterium sp.]